MRTRTGTSGLVAILVIAAGTVWPAASPGAVTIGAKLETLTPLAGAYNCDVPNCTLINSALGPANTAPGGLVSPVTGTITGFRVRTGADPASDVSLRVVRGSGTTFTGAGTGSPVSQAANVTVLHPASLPIRVGDYIGLNCCSGDDGVTTADVPGSGTFLGWGTVADLLLADGETRAADTEHEDNVLMMNADVEPSSAFTFTKPKVKKKTKVVIRVTVPNAGTLRAGLGVSHGSDPIKKRKWPRLFHNGELKVDAAGTVSFVLKLKAFVRKRLAREGTYKAKTQFGIAFTPSLGTELGHVATVAVKG